jgi:mannosyl-glycoprotein endo-beta-N-acetylglucosaminidase
MAEWFGFDGWFINVETTLDNHPGKVEELITWVECLTELVHEAIPDSKVIWYDSITTTGALRWQNALNEHNLPFFDAYVRFNLFLKPASDSRTDRILVVVMEYS